MNLIWILVCQIFSFYRYKLFPLHQNCRTAESIRVCNKEYFWWLLVKEDEGLYHSVDVVTLRMDKKVVLQSSSQTPHVSPDTMVGLIIILVK